MHIHKNRVTFKSNRKFFSKELRGKKPNTIRVLHPDELKYFNSWMDSTAKPIIVIQSLESKNIFCRDIVDVTTIGSLAGHEVIVISWAHPWGRPDEV